jgi:uncharacterized protein (TIGR02001 family)
MHRKPPIIRVITKRPRATLRHAMPILIALTALTGGEVQAQISGSASMVSDYVFRGVSLSDGDPEPQIHLGYDHPSGWYAGAFASRVKLHDHGDEQLITYAGYTRQLQSGLSWEAGATNSAFLQTARYNYAEIFAGLASDNLSGKIYYSPNYYGENVRTAYAEINGTYEVRSHVHLLGHVGFLRVLSSTGGLAPPLTRRFDTRFGVSAGIGDWTCQLAWIATEKDRTIYPQYPKYRERNPRAVVLSALYSF